MGFKKKSISSRPVKVQKYLMKLAEGWVGAEKPYSSMAKFADSAFRTELEKRGVKV